MTKSKMRIYKGRGYSDHAVELYMTITQDKDLILHIDSERDKISIPVDDVLDALQPSGYHIFYLRKIVKD